jgi:hypothetical protein
LVSSNSRRSCFNTSISSLLIGILIFAVTLSSIFPVIPAADAFGLSIHKKITEEALSFLEKDILDEINSGHTSADIIHQFSSEYHFDGCKFQDSTEHINELYDELLAETNPSTFGKILHTAMDFYAHSNWVEIGRSDLIDDGEGLWTVLHPFQLVKGVFIIQGEEKDIPPGLQLDRRTFGKVIYVTAADGKVYPGLISGTIPYEPDDCPNKYGGKDIAVGHWDLLSGHGQGLNKDKPGRDGHEKAVELATAQILHEWCRLVNLVEQTQGEKGKQKLFDKWVADKAAAEQTACPPPDWHGRYEDIDGIKFGPRDAGNNYLETFTNDGEFSFKILSGNSILGKGYGKIEFDIHHQRSLQNGGYHEEYHYNGNGNITFSVGGKYDPEAGKVRLKFFDFSNFHVSFDYLAYGPNIETVNLHNEGDVKGLLGFYFYVYDEACVRTWFYSPCEEHEFEIDLKDGATIELSFSDLPHDTNEPEFQILGPDDFIREPICKGVSHEQIPDRCPPIVVGPPGPVHNYLPEENPFAPIVPHSKITIHSSKSAPTS